MFFDKTEKEAGAGNKVFGAREENEIMTLDWSFYDDFICQRNLWMMMGWKNINMARYMMTNKCKTRFYVASFYFWLRLELKDSQCVFSVSGFFNLS